jgi:hypothetical protein
MTFVPLPYRKAPVQPSHDQITITGGGGWWQQGEVVAGGCRAKW